MVESGQAGASDPGEQGSIPLLGFHAARAQVSGFEIVSLEELRRRMQRRSPGDVHRVDFHSVSVVTRGRTTRMVDFVDYASEPGRAIWVRPGQVQQFRLDDRTAGWHVLFTAAFLAPTGLRVGEWLAQPVQAVVDPDEDAVLAALVAQLDQEYRRGASASAVVLRYTLAAVVARLRRRLAAVGESELPAAYRDLLVAMEQHVGALRHVEEYAGLLGYSTRTLTRACTEVTGRTAKELLDRRLLLEAQRLLGHTDDPVSAIARRLGFSEPTNFTKFFARLSGSSPAAFRRAVRAT